MVELPKKILRIHELTFILPDDFDGTVENAMDLLLTYRKDHLKDARYSDPNNVMSTMELLVTSDKDEKVCGDGALYELVDGKYHLIDATNPYLNDMTEDRKEEVELLREAIEEKIAKDTLT